MYQLRGIHFATGQIECESFVDSHRGDSCIGFVSFVTIEGVQSFLDMPCVKKYLTENFVNFGQCGN